jgi:3-hydroxybutyryl-CoA dehydrogenase
MNFNTIGVCGAGTMGSGIAQLGITMGFQLTLFDLSEEVLEKSKRMIGQNLQVLAEKKKISVEQKEEIFQRIHFTKNLDECVAEVIIEAIIEKEDAKISLFKNLSKINTDQTIFATNTSSLSVSTIANTITNPQRVIGMHFFNPAPIMRLVEVIKGDRTSDEVVQNIVSIAKRLGKIPVVCSDSPGFIVNRVARPYYIESLRLIEEGKVSVEAIDTLLEATGFKLGPFKLMDLIGNDVNYAVSDSVYEQLGKPERLMPSFIQKQKLEKGELGKKTGRGYYTYG